jgi:hypothetical protein
MTNRRPPKKTETLEVRMAPETKRALQDVSRAEDRTASEVVRELIEGYLRQAEMRRDRARLEPTERLAAILRSKPARRSAAAVAAASAIGLLTLVAAPSTAKVDYRTMFDALDANHDGRVTPDEYYANQGAIAFDHLDRNGDGVVTLDEYSQGPK